jgi:hypothetical protein
MFSVFNNKQDLFYEKMFKDYDTAYHWVVNHLNLSDEIEIVNCTSSRYGDLTRKHRPCFASH